MNDADLYSLISHLCTLPDETEWLEFKLNDADPEEIGEYISALSNSAGLHRREAGYLLWGVEDQTHNLKGTSFRPHKRRIGNEELENWLSRLLTPRVDFEIYETNLNGPW